MVTLAELIKDWLQGHSFLSQHCEVEDSDGGWWLRKECNALIVGKLGKRPVILNIAGADVFTIKVYPLGPEPDGGYTFSTDVLARAEDPSFFPTIEKYLREWLKQRGPV